MLHTITVSDFYVTYDQDVVQVLCLPPIILNLLMNAFVHLNLAFYVVFIISLKTVYLSITFILIYILEARCTYAGDPYCTHYCIFYIMFYNYLNHLLNFMTYLFILLPTYLLFYLYPIIALVVF